MGAYKYTLFFTRRFIAIFFPFENPSAISRYRGEQCDSIRELYYCSFFFLRSFLLAGRTVVVFSSVVRQFRYYLRVRCSVFRLPFTLYLSSSSVSIDFDSSSRGFASLPYRRLRRGILTHPRTVENLNDVFLNTSIKNLICIKGYIYCISEKHCIKEL